EAVQGGADLLVFPEYGLMELATLSGHAGDLERSLWAVADFWPDIIAAHQRLADEYAVAILTASGPAYGPGPRPVNRAAFVTPHQPVQMADKQIMTRFERETWKVSSGAPLATYRYGGFTIGVLICYDIEFPLLGRYLVEQGCDMILAPSCTDALAGYWRVRIGAMARALEGQCIVVQAPTVGEAPWSPAVDVNVGAAAIYGPPDRGFPSTGVLCEGALNAPGWVVAAVDPGAIARVRADGQVLNKAHWGEQDPD
ncbi:MAG: carbon-nitrogen hydrolase family protein, partial [Pseudomonadota bacterium]